MKRRGEASSQLESILDLRSLRFSSAAPLKLQCEPDAMHLQIRCRSSTHRAPSISRATLRLTCLSRTNPIAKEAISPPKAKHTNTKQAHPRRAPRPETRRANKEEEMRRLDFNFVGCGGPSCGLLVASMETRFHLLSSDTHAQRLLVNEAFRQPFRNTSRQQTT